MTSSSCIGRGRRTKRARYAAELAEPADSHMKAIAREGQEAANPPGRASRCRCRRQLPRAQSVLHADGETGSAFTYGVLDGQRAEPRSGDPRITKELIT